MENTLAGSEHSKIRSSKHPIQKQGGLQVVAQALRTSKDKDSTTSEQLISVFYYNLKQNQAKQTILTFKCNFLYSIFSHLPLSCFLVLQTTGKSLPSYFLLPSNVYKKLSKLSLILLFPRLNSSSFQPLLAWQILQGLIHTLGPSPYRSNMAFCLLGHGIQDCGRALQMHPQQWRRTSLLFQNPVSKRVPKVSKRVPVLMHCFTPK